MKLLAQLNRKGVVIAAAVSAGIGLVAAAFVVYLAAIILMYGPGHHLNLWAFLRRERLLILVAVALIAVAVGAWRGLRVPVSQGEELERKAFRRLVSAKLRVAMATSSGIALALLLAFAAVFMAAVSLFTVLHPAP